MDLSKDLPLNQNFEIHPLWVPTTPAKTASASSQRSQHPRPSWLEPAVLVADGAQDTTPLLELASQLESSFSSGLPNHLQDVKGNHASALAISGHATTGSNVMLQAPATSSGNVNSLECWSPLLYKNVNAAFNVTGTSMVPPRPPLLVQIGDIQEMPATQNLLLLKEKVILAASVSSISCCSSSQKAEYIIPINSIHNYDSLQESMMSVSNTVTMSAPPTPATTERFYKMMQDKRPSSEVTELVEEGNIEESLMTKEVCLSAPTLEKLARGNDIIVLSEEASDKPVGVQKSSIERNISGFDLNVVTPKKRLQRKKHRPKVFKEEKPSRTPKPVTPQPDTDEQSGRKGSISGKRKYARRKKDVIHSSETALNALGEIVDAESKREAKSVRRCLNFDLGEHRTFDEFSAAMSMFEKVLGARVLKECDESAVTSSSMKEISDSIKVQYQVAVKSSADTVSDLNSSTYQSKNECSKLLQIPVLPAEINKKICASIKQLPILKSSVKHFKALARETACLNSAAVNSPSSSKVAQRNLNPNRISYGPPNGTKRTHLSFDEVRVSDQKRIMHSYNLRGCSSKSYDTGRKDSCTMRIHKRIRMEKWNYNEVNANVSPEFVCTTSNSWKIKQLPNSSQGFTFADSQRFKDQDKVQDSERILSFDQEERYVQNNPSLGTGGASLSSFRSSKRNSTPVKTSKQKNKDIVQPSTPEKLSKFRDTLENKICGNQTYLETSEEIMKSLNTCIKTSTKKQDHDHLLNLVSSSIKHTYVEEQEATWPNCISPVQNIVEGGDFSARSLNGKNLNPETFSVDCQNTYNYNVSAPSSLFLGKLVPFKNLVDDIVRKLRCLSIRSNNEVSSSQAQNSIVPYVGHGGMMVTQERNFYLIKRQRPRAKVDLDPESNRVWKLLMGNDCCKRDEHSDVDKEKWWDEERRVFRGRVDSFIARMHLVQGDRRFTQWKGSVVDSVVGVFLTQNVSDHLSSSAFMALAANFPLSRGKCSLPNEEKINTSTESQDRCIISFIETPQLQRNLLGHGSFQCLDVNVAENEDQKETSNCSETLGSINTSCITYYSRQKGKGKSLYLHEKEATLYQESTVSGSGTNLPEMDDIRLSEAAVTSQKSAVSSQNSMGFHVPSNEHSGSNSLINSEADDLLSGSMSNDALGSSSFTKLLQIAESHSFKEFYSCSCGMNLATKNQESNLTIENNPSLWSQLDFSKGDFQSFNTDSSLHHALLGLSDMSPPTESCQIDDAINSKIMVNNDNLLRGISSHLLSTSCEIISGNDFEVMSKKCSESEGSVAESTSLHKILSSSKTVTNMMDSCVPINKLTAQMEADANLYFTSHKNKAEDIIDSTKKENPNVYPSLQAENVTVFHQKDGNSILKEERTHNAVQAPDQLETCRTQQTEVSNNEIKRNLDVADKAETCSFSIISPEAPISSAKTRRRRPEVEKNAYDWDSLRKDVCCAKTPQERSSTTMDSLDWEAVRIADVSKISETIRERGMNNVLAERIKEFLNRVVREHGSIDLEWLRDVPPDKVKDYLLSIRGLGLKSAECVRLLTLQQLAFPVDTNVGRICVRLGWVPLQPLPESLQLHLLELYPMLATIQKYLWPRLCKLDQRTLYELHYQMITFGKVFCTKRKPNCNSCPMRGECKHFASAFASARLALPAPEDKSVVSFTSPIASEKSQALLMNPTSLPQLEESSNSEECFHNNCEPIVEEPASPEPECPEALESEIEDAFYEDPDEIPTIKLNLEEFTQNLRNYMENNMELQDVSLSKALVALTPEAASIPMPKLKNVSRLRTEHQVYEIPDTHPLLEGVDPREPDDPSPYLLAIWTPGETAQSTELPKTCCNSQDQDQICGRSTCSACNSIREAESHNVRGTLLIPCRTAMRGSFPLNGTYFQVNEVFADHHSSFDPIYVPRDWIWNLPRRTVYFGSSIPTIFRGLTTEGIQQCFWRGFVCVRGFDRVTRAPKPLYARLHIPASKAPKNRKAAEPEVEK